MTDKEFKRLNRSQLIDIIYQLQLKQDELTVENERLSDALNDKRLRIEKAGNIAEAALEMHNVMKAVQEAAEHYLEEMKIRTDEECSKILANAKRESVEIVPDARKEAAEIVANAKKEAAEIIVNAQKEAADIVANAKGEAVEIIPDAEKEAAEIIGQAKKQAAEISGKAKREASTHDYVVKAILRKHGIEK
ncbi:MAG: hypothetical protein IKU13_09925 [Clostridia bacterium]|nr:hypothetical protein [Clostridia bacterium]MBR5266140.1 hypothetical protein [Clostridia bacterium]